MEGPPNFWTLFAEALHLSASRRSILAFVPWHLFLCLLAPLAVVLFSSSLVRQKILDGDAVTVLSAIAVVAGFFGSVSVSTIGNVQRMVSEYPFSSYLKEEHLFDQFLFWPQFTLLLQIFLLLFSAVAAVVIRMFDISFWSKYVIAVDIGLLFYVCTKTWNLVDLMRRLTWHYEEYNRLYKEFRDQNKKVG